MTNSGDLYSADSLPSLRSYVENQGDKFHPLSDQLQVPLRAQAEDTVELLGEVLEILDGYEAAPASKYHLYHTAQLRDRLAPEPDWD